MATSIAVVDDDAAIRDSIQLLLQFQGWRVQTFSSGEAFLAWLPGIESLDCLILDANLPGINGATVARAISARNIPVVGLTAWPSCQAAQDMLHAGVIQLLTKPVTEEHLLAGVWSALSHKLTAA